MDTVCFLLSVSLLGSRTSLPNKFRFIARVFEVFLTVLDGVQGETLWGGESRARDHTHEREQKAGQAAVERTTGQQ